MSGIVHITPWPLEQDGVNTFIRQMAEYAAQFCDVHVVALSDNGLWKADINRGVVRLSVKSEADGVQALSKIAPDIIHHHGPKTGALFDGIDFERGSVIGTEHSWAGNIAPKYPWIVPICGPNVQIRLGVDLDTFKPTDTDGNGDLYSAGIVAQLYEPKIPKAFIDAVGAEGDGLRIAVAGREVDKQRQTLRRLGESGRFSILGELEHSLMPTFYSSINVLLIPSRTEAACLSAVEAMACGCPVVALDTGTGLTDIVADAGILCDSDHELVRVAQMLSVNTDLRAEVSAQCRARAVELYDFKDTAAAFMKLYEERSGGVIKA